MSSEAGPCLPTGPREPVIICGESVSAPLLSRNDSAALATISWLRTRGWIHGKHRSPLPFYDLVRIERPLGRWQRGFLTALWGLHKRRARRGEWEAESLGWCR